MSFNREKLQEIRREAYRSCGVEGLNPSWKRAYERLADAADHLDAMVARTEALGISLEEWDAERHIFGPRTESFNG